MNAHNIMRFYKTISNFCEMSTQTYLSEIIQSRLVSSATTSGRGLHGNGGNFKWTVSAMLGKWNQEFEKCGISEPKESAEHILAHILGTRKISDVYRLKEKVLADGDVQTINKMGGERLKRMPIQYIIQEWDFRDLTLKMSRPVFIPRPETEMLVDIVLNEIDTKRVDKVLELCCGSGAISLALLKSRTQLQAMAIDKSEDACKLTRENAEINGLANRIQLIKGEVGSDFRLNITFDIIVSNPPYVPRKDMDDLQPEIKLYEDPAALDGGLDGLTVIKSILEVCSSLLNCGAKLFLEVDPSHPAVIKSWLQQNDSLRLMFLRSFADFSGKERFVEVMKEK